MSARKQILIPVNVGEDYQTGLRRRLKEYGITQREVAQEMGVDDTQFSRWVGRPSADTGRAVAIRIDNVISIETAIIAILARRDRHVTQEHSRGNDKHRRG
jgi:predicted transcriptional regulator